jgi:Fur family ferric uptake transcriptional regulator
MTRPKPTDTADVLHEVRARIHAAGLRRTTARIAVLRELRAAGTPMSHAEVAGRLAAQGFDKTTVYRNLVELAEANIVSRFELGDHVWRFEWRAEGAAHDAEHPHFLCLDCGDISCLNDVTVHITPSPGTRRSGMAAVTEVLLKGHCNRCG